MTVVDAEEAGALQRALAKADGVACWRLTVEDTRDARRLRLVQALSAGAEWIDPAALPAGCTLCNVYAHENAIGEWVLLGMLTLTRQLLRYDRDLRAGEWHRAPRELPLERELRGRTVGAIGFGHIGQRVAELALALGMEVAGVTREPGKHREAGERLRWLGGLDELHRLLKEADFAVVGVPRTAETVGLIGRPELAALGPTGYLLNVARGAIVQEEPLYEALRDRVIAGAALDVWYRYPRSHGEGTRPSAFPFWELDNVVMTPHVSGRSEETERGRRAFVAEQFARFAEGHPLENVLAGG